MPAPAGEVLVAVEVAVREDVEAGALLVADHDGERILELLAEADVEHAGVERLAPHAGVEPARTRPGAGDGARQNQIAGDGEWHGRIAYATELAVRGFAGSREFAKAVFVAHARHFAFGRAPVRFRTRMATSTQKLAVFLAFVAAALSFAAVAVTYSRTGSIQVTPLGGGAVMLALGVSGYRRLNTPRA